MNSEEDYGKLINVRETNTKSAMNSTYATKSTQRAFAKNNTSMT